MAALIGQSTVMHFCVTNIGANQVEKVLCLGAE